MVVVLDVNWQVGSVPESNTIGSGCVGNGRVVKVRVWGAEGPLQPVFTTVIVVVPAQFAFQVIPINVPLKGVLK